MSCNLGPDDCEFENGLCSWVNVQNDQLDWTRRSGSTPSKDTGPSGDHTSGDGNIFIMDLGCIHIAQAFESIERNLLY